MRQLRLQRAKPLHIQGLAQFAQSRVILLIALTDHRIVGQHGEQATFMIEQQDLRRQFDAAEIIGVERHPIDGHGPDLLQMQGSGGKGFQTVTRRLEKRAGIEAEHPRAGVIADIKPGVGCRYLALIRLARPAFDAVAPFQTFMHLAAHQGISVDAPGDRQTVASQN